MLWHTLIDALAVFSFQSWEAYITEALVAVTAIVSLVIIFKLRDFSAEAKAPVTDQADEHPRSVRPLPVTDAEDITKEQIEDSRFL